MSVNRQVCGSYCATIEGAAYFGVEFSFQVKFVRDSALAKVKVHLLLREKIARGECDT